MFVAYRIAISVKYLPGAGRRELATQIRHMHENRRKLLEISENKRLLEHSRVAQVLRFVQWIIATADRKR